MCLLSDHASPCFALSLLVGGFRMFLFLGSLLSTSSLSTHMSRTRIRTLSTRTCEFAIRFVLPACNPSVARFACLSITCQSAAACSPPSPSPHSPHPLPPCPPPCMCVLIVSLRQPFFWGDGDTSIFNNPHVQLSPEHPDPPPRSLKENFVTSFFRKHSWSQQDISDQWRRYAEGELTAAKFRMYQWGRKEGHIPQEIARKDTYAQSATMMGAQMGKKIDDSRAHTTWKVVVPYIDPEKEAIAKAADEESGRIR